jgi:catechol 2,3-dioxygenase-like lactoylglutathione lyase family enzyme
MVHGRPSMMLGAASPTPFVDTISLRDNHLRRHTVGSGPLPHLRAGIARVLGFFQQILWSRPKGTSVLDHVSVGVTNIDRSRKFYDPALRPLGLVRIVDFGEGRGSDYGVAPGSLGVEFTITNEAKIKTPIPGAHLCFRAPDRKAVDAFYAAALAAGGRDDGAPGLRPHYHADYYCAFVLDPDGHRIEAVCHAPKRPVILATG